MLYVPSYRSVYFNLSKLDFTQLLVLSLLSKSFFWRTSPTPPGAPNFSTMALVFLNCFSSIKCWTQFRYVSRVCFSGGTGTFGNAWGHKIIGIKYSECLIEAEQLLTVFMFYLWFTKRSTDKRTTNSHVFLMFSIIRTSFTHLSSTLGVFSHSPTASWDLKSLTGLICAF